MAPYETTDSLRLIDGPAVWHAADLRADESWIWRLSAEDLEQGDIQILNNYAVLHARDGFEDWPEQNKRRHLLRLWINLDSSIARPLDPVFAAKNNTGPRGAIHIQNEHSGWVPQ
jgi:Taurine catabolism dioxygenase TauD, TfdA family